MEVWEGGQGCPSKEIQGRHEGTTCRTMLISNAHVSNILQLFARGSVHDSTYNLAKSTAMECEDVKEEMIA